MFNNLQHLINTFNNNIIQTDDCQNLQLKQLKGACGRSSETINFSHLKSNIIPQVFPVTTGVLWR